MRIVQSAPVSRCIARWATTCALAGALLLPAPAGRTGTALPQFISIDVDGVSIDGDFRLDGMSFPVDFGDTGILSLSGSGDDEVVLGLGADQSYGPLLAISGSYEPSYRILFSSGGVPINPITPVDPIVALTADGTVDVDVESITIQPSFELNGDPFPSAATQHAEFFLRDPATGLELPLGVSFSPSATVRLIPGVYDVVYRYVSGNQIPENQNAVVQAGVLVDTSGKFTIDVPCMLHRLDYFIDGSPPPVSQAERGAIALHDFATGDSVSFDETDALVSIRHILPGTYDVTYSHVAGGSIVPRNSLAVVLSDLSIQPPDVSTIVDVTTVVVTPDPTLDGAPFPASAAEDGNVILVGEHDDRVDLGITSTQPMPAVRIVAGTYDAYYERDSGGSITPANAFGRIADEIDLNTTTTLSVDVTTVSFAPTFTVDGQAFPASLAERGDFSLQGAHPDDTIALGSSHQAIPSKRIIVGSYDVVYDWVAGGTLVPRNHAQVVATTPIDIGSPTAFGLETQVVQHDVTLDSVLFPNDPGQSGDLVLLAVGSDGQLDLGSTSDAPVPVRSLVGSYGVHYRWVAGDQVPLNTDAKIGAVFVPEPGAGLALLFGAALLGALKPTGRPRSGRPAAERSTGA
jgi:hypothetical protein